MSLALALIAGGCAIVMVMFVTALARISARADAQADRDLAGWPGVPLV